MKLSKTKLKEIIQEVLDDALVDEARVVGGVTAVGTGAARQPSTVSTDRAVEPKVPFGEPPAQIGQAAAKKFMGAAAMKTVLSKPVVQQAMEEIRDTIAKQKGPTRALGLGMLLSDLGVTAAEANLVASAIRSAAASAEKDIATRAKKTATLSARAPQKQKQSQKSATSSAPTMRSGGRAKDSPWGANQAGQRGRAAAQEAIVRALGKILEEGRKRKG